MPECGEASYQTYSPSVLRTGALSQNVNDASGGKQIEKETQEAPLW
jgi:hypothetical protein